MKSTFIIYSGFKIILVREDNENPNPNESCTNSI